MTDISASPPTPSFSWPRLDRGPVIVALAMFVIGSAVIGQVVDLRQTVLFLIGGLLGATLYHASFGFTGGWRRLVVEKRGSAVRAQMLMVAIAAIVFIPLLAGGTAFSNRWLSAILRLYADDIATLIRQRDATLAARSAQDTPVREDRTLEVTSELRVDLPATLRALSP